jgi:hypothetical protein
MLPDPSALRVIKRSQFVSYLNYLTVYICVYVYVYVLCLTGIFNHIYLCSYVSIICIHM